MTSNDSAVDVARRYYDVPATGVRIRTTYIGTFHLQGGRIVGQQVYYDQLALALQLGMLPAPA